ncbi:GNAT family N-acetyltransferase [Virgibacillus profundi]|uniref:GNAT family N-acetyltransferase n=1 Tax=Virgibacillus profundi TaxID=2024555 RepID=A0A2A2IH41_9BACI|nr:GNAT family N-acetyltransferase [Virgibacillus profundi]PAV30564.1 GNAT family N-acetyltransferase [Virgibacillus profundi]PXY54736.1 GNAT family N-acetyltransferase [Virgibacillus profundi]
MIRTAIREDAANLASLIKQVETESDYMLYESAERNISAEKQATMIDRLSAEENSTILVSEINHQLVGYLFVIGGNARRNQHCAYIVIGILSSYQGKSIGTTMFEELEHWALNQKIHRLELTVVKENRSGLKLYEKMGFNIEGTKKDSLYIDGKYYDEYYMSKLLEG